MQYFRDILAQESQLEPTMRRLEDLLERYVHTAIYNNLDVVIGQRHPLDPSEAFHHTVIKAHGGMCIDNNLSFFHLLQKIGYQVHLTEGFSLHYNNHPLDFSHSAHMLIIATLDDQQYVLDPGFGNSARKPIPLTGETIEHAMATFKVVKSDHDQYGLVKRLDKDYVQYTFDPKKTMACADFTPHLDYIHSDDSVFRHTFFVTKALSDRVMSIMDNTFKIEYANGTTESHDVLAKGGLRRLLIETFGLPKTYIDEVNFEQAHIVAATKQELQKMWLADPIRMSFTHNAHKSPQPDPNQSTITNNK